MASTYVNDLRLNEMATGDASGTWGTVTNTNLELISEAFGFGTEAITTNANTHTSTIADGATDPVRAMYVKYTGALDSDCTITIAPNTLNRVHIIENATTDSGGSGPYNIIIKQGSGATVTIANGQVSAVYLDGAGSGAAVLDALTDLSIAGTFNAAADIVAAGTLQAAGDTAAGDDAAIGYTSALGIIVTGQGSTNDITLVNDADATVLAVPTGTTNVDIVGVATAETFEPDGDTAAGDNAAIGYTAAEGLILTGQGSTNDVTLKNDADADVLVVPTGTTNVDIVGVTTAATFEPDGDTAAGDNAAIGYTAAEGLILTGQGSTSDVTIKNDADATVASIATGTTILTVNDDVTVVGRAIGSTITAEDDATYDLATANNFTTTTAGSVTMTFTNAAAGQSGSIKFVNGGNHTVSAHADVAINADILTAISATGTYFVTYYVTAASGNNTILVGATAILT